MSNSHFSPAAQVNHIRSGNAAKSGNDIARRKDTGEPGNGGQFGTSVREASGLSLSRPGVVGVDEGVGERAWQVAADLAAAGLSGRVVKGVTQRVSERYAPAEHLRFVDTDGVPFGVQFDGGTVSVRVPAGLHAGRQVDSEIVASQGRYGRAHGEVVANLVTELSERLLNKPVQAVDDSQAA